MTRTLADFGIKISLDPPTEEKTIIKSNIDWNEAVELAKQCREHHPEEPIEIIPVGSTGQVTVVRCIR